MHSGQNGRLLQGTGGVRVKPQRSGHGYGRSLQAVDASQLKARGIQIPEKSIHHPVIAAVGDDLAAIAQQRQLGNSDLVALETDIGAGSLIRFASDITPTNENVAATVKVAHAAPRMDLEVHRTRDRERLPGRQQQVAERRVVHHDIGVERRRSIECAFARADAMRFELALRFNRCPVACQRRILNGNSLGGILSGRIQPIPMNAPQHGRSRDGGQCWRCGRTGKKGARAAEHSRKIGRGQTTLHIGVDQGARDQAGKLRLALELDRNYRDTSLSVRGQTKIVEHAIEVTQAAGAEMNLERGAPGDRINRERALDLHVRGLAVGLKLVDLDAAAAVEILRVDESTERQISPSRGQRSDELEFGGDDEILR